MKYALVVTLTTGIMLLLLTCMNFFLGVGNFMKVVSVTPRPRFSPGQRNPGTHCTGGWVGPRAGLDTEARGKIVSPLPGNLGRPVVQPVARHSTD
jgi:hypothetical protein